MAKPLVQRLELVPHSGFEGRGGLARRHLDRLPETRVRRLQPGYVSRKGLESFLDVLRASRRRLSGSFVG